MNADYDDIRSRIGEEPRWFDEAAVPRYVDFSPREIANIYARECALILVRCQSCEREFRVAISIDQLSAIHHWRAFVRLSNMLRRTLRGRAPGVRRELLRALMREVKDIRAKLARAPLRDEMLEYGDPPNVGCCAAGPTMNSVPVSVIQFWTCHDPLEGWKREPEREGKDITPDWAKDPR